jgi:SAM-dependent methyltransferase
MEARSTFTLASDAYARNRPVYPPELYSWIASRCSARRAAWDCGTGNGQAAAALSAYFDRIDATDISTEQIEHGFQASNVSYSAQPAERTSFPDESFDLITVAQALHWFDFNRFWPEVRRTARPGAFFCAWGYSWFQSGAKLEELFVNPLLALLEPHWAMNNHLLWNGYRNEDIGFPFPRIDTPSFAIATDWTIAEFIDYVGTWSAYKLARQEEAVAREIAKLELRVLALFPDDRKLRFVAPLTIVAGPVV